MAALSIVAKGGLIPHVKQGGIGKASFAVEGSKLEGTGFENEHIGQTHVPVATGGVIALCNTEGLKGLAERETGVEADEPVNLCT